MPDEILTASAVARRAGERLGRRVRPGTVLEWAKSGRLPIIGRNHRGVWLFSQRAVARVVQLTTGADEPGDAASRDT